jgi:protein-S-isoprenylcysteine O-methyltransferase Ste14
MDRKSLYLGILLTVLALGQVVATWQFYDQQANTTIINLGWGVIFLSAIFGWLPIFTLRYRGNISGKSYIHTTTLVESGVYRIVRHPQYLAGVLVSIGLCLITTHWLVILLGFGSWLIYYLNTYLEENLNIQKFGEAYHRYQERVPRLNFLLGLYRVLRQQMDVLQE